MGILENKAAREGAESIIEFTNSIKTDLPECCHVRFLQIIRDELIEQCPLLGPDKPKYEPMSDDDSREFGATLMPYGMHKNKPIDEIPMKYLEFLFSEKGSIGFAEKLNHYLASPRIQAER